jgi:HD-like signal output (HDOD) protein
MTGPPRDTGEPTDALERRLRFILRAGDFPALSNLFTEAMSISVDSAASSQRLANLVLRDYGLTVKVIRTANTLHYNRTGKPIRSATHAMLLLGVRTVRDLATSLILFDHFQGKSPGLKELMLLSMLTATHARELAARVGLPDPEEAHLCGMFRNLGEVLVAAHFPDDYAKVLEKMRVAGNPPAGKPNVAFRTDPMTMQRAAQSVLGFTYEDLGIAVARHWSMPESVLVAMRATGPSTNQPLVRVVTFSHELTSAIYRDDAARGVSRLADAVRRNGPGLRVDEHQIAEVLERAVSDTKDVFATARVSLDDLRLRKQTAEALRVLSAGIEDAGPSAETSSATSEPMDELRGRLVQEAENALNADRGYGLEAVVLILLEALLRGGPFDRVVFAIATGDRTRIEGRIALGAGADKLIPQLRVSTLSAPVAVALARRRVELRPVGRGMTGDEVKWCSAVGAGAFGVAPLLVDDKLVGCLYADCTTGCEAAEAGGEFLETVAGLASRAIASRRSAAVTGTPTGSAVRPLADRAALVIRLIREESVETVAATSGVSVTDLEEWKRAFLEGAMQGLATPPSTR